MHRLDLCSYSYPKELWGNGVRTHVNAKGKFPLPEAQRRIELQRCASGRTASPTYYRLSYSRPLWSCQVGRGMMSGLGLSTCFHPCTPTLSLIIINNKNRIKRHNSRFITISSLRCEPSPTGTLKWPGCNGVQITCNTISTYHAQHVMLLAKGTAQLFSLTEFKTHLFELYFIGWTTNWMKPASQILHTSFHLSTDEAVKRLGVAVGRLYMQHCVDILQCSLILLHKKNQNRWQQNEPH